MVNAFFLNYYCLFINWKVEYCYLKNSKFPSILLEKVKWSEVAQSCPTLCNPMDYSPPGSSVLEEWNFPGKNIGVGFHFLLQGLFLTQGSNPGLLHCRQTLLPFEPPGKWYFQASYLPNAITSYHPWTQMKLINEINFAFEFSFPDLLFLFHTFTSTKEASTF